MFLNSGDKDWLLRVLGVKEEEYEFKNNYNILEIVNENGNPEEYYLEDFRGNDNRFNSFKQNIEQYFQTSNVEIKPLMIFKSWEQEQEFLDTELDKVNANGKRDINKFLASARPVYYNKNKEISLELEDDGINYLEYKVSNKESKGLIFNLSLQELYKLYNRTGVNLFRDNVRVGISDNKSSSLRNNFKTTFLLGLYSLNKNKNLKSKEKIKEYLIDRNGSEDFDGYQTALENFWFHHNGITIYSEDSFQIEEDKITFDPLTVSVINGAQTLTHCFSIIREIRNDLRKNEDFEELINEMMFNIKIKTIFIEADSEMKRSVTLGLNTQIPVNLEDIITSSSEVDKINNILEQKNKRICRQGEDTENGGFYLLDFVKSYLVFKGKPGEARNLQKNKIESYLKEIWEFLSTGNENRDEFLKDIDTFQYIDKWWRKRQKPENVKEIDYKGLGSNGKYYFKSFCKDIYNDAEDGNDKDEYFQGIYEYFINTFIKLQSNIDSNELKKDNLFEKYLESLENSINYDNKINNLGNSLENFVEKFEDYKKSNDSKSSRSMFIKSLLEEEGINIKFRTVTLKYHSENKYTLNEAFSFPSQTFSQLYEINSYPNVYDDEDKLIHFEDSEFKKEIHREFYLFVFIEDLSSSLKNIELISNFSFVTLAEDAKKVYEKTVQAFKKGDVNLFVKQSEELCFHVRPKAKDGKDTFSFTDGSQQVKRTFWVNKDCLLKLIETKLKNKTNIEKTAELV